MAQAAIFGDGMSYSGLFFCNSRHSNASIAEGASTTRGSNAYGLRLPVTLGPSGRSSSMSSRLSAGSIPTSLHTYGSSTTSSLLQ